MESIIKKVEDVRNDLRSNQEEVVDQIHRLESQGKWIDWVGHFGKRITKMNDFTQEEKKEFLNGVIEKITVNTIDIQNHELNIDFKYPYVDDKFLWKDQSNKSLGYDIEDGKKDISLVVESLKKK